MSPLDTNEVADASVERDGAGTVTYRCTACGATVDASEWHPVAIGANRESVYLFCGEACLDRWDTEGGGT